MGDRDATSPTGGNTTGDTVFELEQWMTSPNRFWVYHCTGANTTDKKRVLLGSTNVTAVLLKNMAALKKTKDEETEEASA